MSYQFSGFQRLYDESPGHHLGVRHLSRCRAELCEHRAAGLEGDPGQSHSDRLDFLRKLPFENQLHDVCRYGDEPCGRIGNSLLRLSRSQHELCWLTTGCNPSAAAARYHGCVLQLPSLYDMYLVTTCNTYYSRTHA